MSTAQVRTARIAAALDAWLRAVPPTGGIHDRDTLPERLAEAERLEDILVPLLAEARDGVSSTRSPRDREDRA